MKKIKLGLIVIGICLIVFLGFLIWYFSGDMVERICIKGCKNIEMNFVNYEISKTYNFVACGCSINNTSDKLYFDLDTKEELTSQDILKRVLGG